MTHIYSFAYNTNLNFLHLDMYMFKNLNKNLFITSVHTSRYFNGIIFLYQRNKFEYTTSASVL